MINKLFFTVTMAFLFFSCHQSPSDKSNAMVPEDAFEFGNVDLALEPDLSPPPYTMSKENPQNAVREKNITKIIKEGDMHVEVEKLDVSKDFVDSLVAQSGGYYEKEVFRHLGDTEKYQLKLRIPSGRFEPLVKELEAMEGTVHEKNINARDVTEEYLDLEIRIDNNKAYLVRYKEMLQKAKTIEEMVEVQEKIRQIELLIDSNLGRLKYLSDKASFSTLSLSLTSVPEVVVASAPSFFSKMKDSFNNGFNGLKFFVLVMINLWPFILIVFLIVFFRKKIGRWFRRNSKPNAIETAHLK